MTGPRDPHVPPGSVVFGYGATAPLVIAALAAWLMPHAWPVVAGELAVIWAALVLAFVGGVRRGFGFATPGAGTAAEVVPGMIYFALAGLALILLVAAPYTWLAFWPLAVGLVLVALLDRRAAVRGLAPAHFARLRPPQMLVCAAALVALWVRTLF